MAGICRPGPAEGEPPLAGHNRRSLIVWNDCSMARRVKIGSLHARCQGAHTAGLLQGCAPGPEAGRRRLPVGNRPTGYKITLSMQLNKWLEHDGLAVRCTALGDADRCSIPWRSNFVSFADPAALVQFQVFPPALREARVRFPRLLRGIGSKNVIRFI